MTRGSRRFRFFTAHRDGTRRRTHGSATWPGFHAESGARGSRPIMSTVCAIPQMDQVLIREVTGHPSYLPPNPKHIGAHVVDVLAGEKRPSRSLTPMDRIETARTRSGG